MAISTTTKIKPFIETLQEKFVQALADEYKVIVKKHKEQIDKEFDMAVASKVTDMSVFLSERMNIIDMGSSLKLEIYKPK